MNQYYLIFPVVFALKMCIFLALLPYGTAFKTDAQRRSIMRLCLISIIIGTSAIAYVGIITNQPIEAMVSTIVVCICMYTGGHYGRKALQGKTCRR